MIPVRGWFVLGVCGVLFSAAGSSGADWPMFAGGPSLCAVADGRMQSRPKVLWRVQVDEGALSSPAVVGGRVYVTGAGGQAACLDAASGRVRWKVRPAGDASLESSCLVTGGLVVFGGTDHAVHALDRITGRGVWRQPVSGKVLAPPVPARGPGGRAALVVGSYGSALHCLAVADGKPLWVAQAQGYVNGAACVVGSRVTFGSCDGMVRAVDVLTGKVTHVREVGSYVPGSVATAGDSVFAGLFGNQVICLDGKDLTARWTRSIGNFPVFSSVCVDPARVYVGARDRKVHALDRLTGRPVWSFATRGRVDATPILVGSTLVVGSEDGRLYGLEASGGGLRWVLDLGASVKAAAAFGAGRLYVGTEDGTLVALETP